MRLSAGKLALPLWMSLLPFILFLRDSHFQGETCADPGIFVKGVEVGGPGQTERFLVSFLVINLFYRGGPMVLFQRNVKKL